ncbi:MAG TPA: APH(3') family aminoglycoside O-phosphotransferase [Gemmatimonadaceae bacterium]|nr:APH(3') family aminoglycoside O-phosphotransferase [Gemmatimonadaceae bacterium]
MEIPIEIAAHLPGYAFAPVGIGESGAAVRRCTARNQPTRYLKVAPLDAKLRLDREDERLRWMHGRELFVPAVREYGCIDGYEYLLLDEIAGADASDLRWHGQSLDVATALGTGLARLHRTNVVDCPFDQRIARQIEEARAQVTAGHVREDEFDESRLGRSASEVLIDLLATIPADEDLVLVHGDFCLPNVILKEVSIGTIEVAGMVDCGRAGVADRYQDLALAIRSIDGNIGSEWVAPFLRAYGLDVVREDKVEFFMLLDEFF